MARKMRMPACSTFVIKGVSQDAMRLRLFPFSLLGRAKQWFYANKAVVDTWDKCAKAFVAKFFPTTDFELPAGIK